MHYQDKILLAGMLLMLIGLLAAIIILDSRHGNDK
jgi:hypothetical protein